MTINRIDPEPVAIKYTIELTMDEFDMLETAVDLLYKSSEQLYPQASMVWVSLLSTMKVQINTTL